MELSQVLQELISGPERRLSELPRTKGVYALIDHAGQTRYIGKAVNTDFSNRINSRHTTGSEGNSHKFSHTYNTGRMWRAKNDQGDMARLVKAFRTDFIRHYCRARVVAIDADATTISTIESGVIALAPRSAIEWNEKREHRAHEPIELVNELLASTVRHPLLQEAMEHQSHLFSGLNVLRNP